MRVRKRIEIIYYVQRRDIFWKKNANLGELDNGFHQFIMILCKTCFRINNIGVYDLSMMLCLIMCIQLNDSKQILSTSVV